MSNPDLEWYKKYPAGFLSDFWATGNSDLNIAIEPRSVQSGRWYTVTWKTGKGKDRQVEGQRYDIVWERLIKRFLSDEKYSRAQLEII